ncbi:hypothetical protein ABL78_0002 [Leptomonas seymouri]|uniref:Uncharacterized protein n=1 Tax=Leptomonas seymouri TaxID=5684 RepID=A0A0N0P972_LEPSE|nr:hypothetical protein ABL78_0002 [Leptomonas seymouri]|eukprot:KPI90769.1 hypothetical protein ABL78_0002 [Leptomonas seymouri]
MSYQFNVEVVNAILVDSLTGINDKAKHVVTLRCVRRDATFDCTQVPMSFEVRNAPSYDFLECKLALRDDAHTVLAYSTTPLLIGGPHRIVGAVWVPLEAVGLSLSAEDGETPSRPMARLFVSWTMSKMDGSQLCASELEAPSSVSAAAIGCGGLATASATSRTSAETSPLSAVDPARGGDGAVMAISALTSTSRRGSDSTGFPNADALSGDGGGNSNSPGGTPHMPTVLDEAEVATQLRSGERGGAGSGSQRLLTEPASIPHGDADAQEGQRLIRLQFPRCRVSSPLSDTADAAAGADDAAKANGGASSSPTWVNLYATSTQSIGCVPAEKRYRNLYLFPCALLLDQLTPEMHICPSSSVRGAASLTSKKAGDTYSELWRVAHRHGDACSLPGTASSAVEAIRLEREARQRRSVSCTTPAAATAGAPHGIRSGPNDAPGADDLAVRVPGESTLALLRQKAMAAMRQRRVTYSA